MPNTEDIRALYQVAFEMHRAIQDFRAKLLAILPLVSGAGLAVLLEIYKTKTSDVMMQHLFGFGIFGFLIILGVYIYELRSIQNCHAIQSAARDLERAVCMVGIFRYEEDNSKPVAGVVRMTVASRIIYCTLMGAWVYVACFGLLKSVLPNGESQPMTDPAISTISLIAGIVVLITGYAVSYFLQSASSRSNRSTNKATGAR